MENGQKNQEGIVGGQNSQGTASVEARVVAGLVAGIEQNPGDEKAGEHKEQVDAHPARFSGEKDDSRPAGKVKSAVGPEEGVQKKNAQYGQAPQGIQFGHDRTDQLLCGHEGRVLLHSLTSEEICVRTRLYVRVLFVNQSR